MIFIKIYMNNQHIFNQEMYNTYIDFVNNPLDQFEIRDLISLKISLLNNLNISLTNITLYLFLGSLVSLYLHLLTNNNLTLLSSK